MHNKKNHFLAETALIAALYTALTYISGLFGMSYLGVQFRISEALTVLPLFTPAAIPGLVVGCILGNLGSPLGIIDIVCGTLATFAASLLTRALRKKTVRGFPLFALLPPIVLNAVTVGLEIAFFADTGFSWGLFALSALQVGLGEAAVLLVLGAPLYMGVKRSGLYTITPAPNSRHS